MNQRISQHLHSKKSLISKAIIKYGLENFDISVIDEAESREDINQKEIFWIKYFSCISPNGYNLDDGGYGGAPSDNARKKISNSLKGRFKGSKNPMFGKQSPMKGKTGGMKGKKHKIETIEKMKASRTGDKSSVAKKVLNIDTGESFTSQKEASEKYNISRSCICCACKGIQKTAAGYRWKCIN